MDNPNTNSNVRINSKLKDHIQMCEKENQTYQKAFAQLQQSLRKQIDNQMSVQMAKHKDKFHKMKASIQKQLVSLQHYATVQHPPDLHPLYTSISSKLHHNLFIISQFSMTFTLPYPSSLSFSIEDMQRKLTLYQNQIKQIKRIASSISSSINTSTSTSKGSLQIASIMNDYEKIMQNEGIYQSVVKINSHFEQGMALLSQYRNIQQLHLSLSSQNGIISLGEYCELTSALSSQRVHLKRLTLYLMDMEFDQQKCDILRKRISGECKLLKKVEIVNYYHQCKLGQFIEFNWAPFRKEVHIKAKVWK